MNQPIRQANPHTSTNQTQLNRTQTPGKAPPPAGPDDLGPKTAGAVRVSGLPAAAGARRVPGRESDPDLVVVAGMVVVVVVWATIHTDTHTHNCRTFALVRMG
jgi:hypothetical protein